MQPGNSQKAIRVTPISNHDSIAPETEVLTKIDNIRALVPHSENMCLLERVLDWNTDSIRCETNSHLKSDNPLRRNGRLSSICGIEYAAQAMALHGALCSGDGAPAGHGFLASVRDTQCHTPTLDANASPLQVAATLVFGQGSHMIYTFSINCDQEILVTGRAAVVTFQDSVEQT